MSDQEDSGTGGEYQLGEDDYESESSTDTVHGGSNLVKIKRKKESHVKKTNLTVWLKSDVKNRADNGFAALLDEKVAGSCSESDNSEVFPLYTSLSRPQSDIEFHSDSASESDLSDCVDEDVMRDTNNPGLYIRKVMKSNTTKSGKKKKHDRVYNSFQYCGICCKTVSNFAQHLIGKGNQEGKHKASSDVRQIEDEKEAVKKKKLLSLLRNTFNHMQNIKNFIRRRGRSYLKGVLLITSLYPNTALVHIAPGMGVH